MDRYFPPRDTAASPPSPHIPPSPARIHTTVYPDSVIGCAPVSTDTANTMHSPTVALLYVHKETFIDCSRHPLPCCIPARNAPLQYLMYTYLILSYLKIIPLQTYYSKVNPY